MHAPIPTDFATTADPLRVRIAHWRETRSYRGGAMPAGLWAEAIVLARRHGVGPTARMLRIDYASLKRRLTADGASATDAGPSLVDMGAAVDIPGAPRGAYSRVLRGYWWPETAKGAGEGALRGIRCKFVAS